MEEKEIIKFREGVEIETINHLFSGLRSITSGTCKRMQTIGLDELGNPHTRLVVSILTWDEKRQRNKCVGHFSIGDSIFKEDLYYFGKLVDLPWTEIIFSGVLIFGDGRIRLKYNIIEDLGEGEIRESSGLGLYRRINLDDSGLVPSIKGVIYKVQSASNYPKIIPSKNP